VNAYAALPRFRSDGGFRPWLLRIVCNETLPSGACETGRMTQDSTPSTYLDGEGMVSPMQMSLITAERVAPSSAESVP
jgi:hypothetical protein